MNTINTYAVQAVKVTAVAGGLSVFLLGSMIAFSWVLFQCLVYLTPYLS